jgi:hypothetical protein
MKRRQAKLRSLPTRKAWDAWLFGGLRKLHPDATEAQLVLSMQVNVDLYGMDEALCILSDEFERIGWPRYP